MLRNKVWRFAALLMVLALVLTACGGTTEPVIEPETEAETVTEAEPMEEADVLKVAFIYIGQPGDLGWTYEHDRGRQMVVDAFGDSIEVITVPDVPDWDPAAAEKAIRDVVADGADIVFTTSFGYMDPTLTVAQDYPDVIFEHCSGYKTDANMSTYFGRIYQPRYLAGLVAGSMLEDGFIGYVAAFAIPEVVRGINAFTLGVRAVNPEAEVHVVWTNTWYDPVLEREAAEALLDEGATIITQHQDTTEPQKAAQERGMLSVGYDSDMAQFVGDTVLTSPIWNWGPYYISRIEAVMDGTWESGSFWGGLVDEVVMLADLSPLVPEDVVATVTAAEADLVAGETDVFCGPIAGQDGTIVVAEGECMADGDMLGMDWFVEGVFGNID